MSEHRESDDLPEDLKGPLLRLWKIEQPLVVRILPRDAWTICAIVQFATRNPALSPTQRQLTEAFGRELQRGLVEIDPALEKYLEMGWDPRFDGSD